MRNKKRVRAKQFLRNMVFIWMMRKMGHTSKIAVAKINEWEV